MVDFYKALEESKRRGKFLGYCNDCDTDGKIHEVDILPAYKDAPPNQQKAKCPNCGHFMVIGDLIPF